MKSWRKVNSLFGDTSEMDEFDLRILTTLSRDSRASLTQMSDEVGLSRFAVKDRIQKLFDNGVILGPMMVVNPLFIGFQRTVFFEFKTNPHEPWLAKLLEKTSECDLLDGITGEYSLFARLRLKDDEHFNQILKKIDTAMGGSYFKKYRVVNAIKTFKESDVSFGRMVQRTPELDGTDRAILNILLKQANQAKSPFPESTVELSKSLNEAGVKISQPAVFNRLSKLQRSRVILRQSVRVDHSKLGLHMKFLVRVKANPKVYDAVAEESLAPMPEISDLYRTGEEYGLLAILRVKGVSEFNSFLVRLYDSSDVIDTYTTLVLEERKNSPTFLASE
jgi:Lrp/AsnC family leucine-responsive transcriptional regulator